MAPKKSKNTITVQDRYGNDIEVQAGVDGKNPVSPENPPAKALMTDAEQKAADADKPAEADEKKTASSTAPAAKK